MKEEEEDEVEAQGRPRSSLQLPEWRLWRGGGQVLLHILYLFKLECTTLKELFFCPSKP